MARALIREFQSEPLASLLNCDNATFLFRNFLFLVVFIVCSNIHDHFLNIFLCSKVTSFFEAFNSLLNFSISSDVLSVSPCLLPVSFHTDIGICFPQVRSKHFRLVFLPDTFPISLSLCFLRSSLVFRPISLLSSTSFVFNCISLIFRNYFYLFINSIFPSLTTARILFYYHFLTLFILAYKIFSFISVLMLVMPDASISD